MLRALFTRFLDDNALRWTLAAPLCMAFGAAVYLELPYEPDWLFVTIPILVSIIAGCFKLNRIPFADLLIIFVFAFGAGFSAAKLKCDLVKSPMLDSDVGIVRIEGVLTSIEHGAKGNRLRIRASAISGMTRQETPRYVRVTQRRPSRLDPGRPIRCLAMLAPPPYSALPGDFNFPRQAYFQQLGGVGFVLGECQPISFDLTQRGWLGKFQDHLGALRRKIALHVSAASGEKSGGMVAAMISGDRSLMPADQVEVLRASGLAHLLAISGLHMGLAGGVFFWGALRLLTLVEPLALRWPPPRVAACFALAACTAYLLISGASVATQRAYIMAVIAFSAKVFDQPALSLRSLAIAMVLVTLVQPETVVSPGYQMSFAATAALIAVYETTQKRKTGSGVVIRGWRFFWGIAFASLTASLATAPFAAFHFNRVASLSIPANILTTPIISFWAAPSAALAGVTFPFGGEEIFLKSLGKALEVILMIATLMSSGEGGDLRPMGTMAFAGFIVATSCFVILNGRWRWLSSIPMAVASIAWLASPLPIAIVDAHRQVYVHSPDGWIHIKTIENTKKSLPPLQISDDLTEHDCRIEACNIQLKQASLHIRTDPNLPFAAAIIDTDQQSSGTLIKHHLNFQDINHPVRIVVSRNGKIERQSLHPSSRPWFSTNSRAGINHE